MADFEVYLDLDGHVLPVGLARSNRVRGGETILFKHDDRWLARSNRLCDWEAGFLDRDAPSSDIGSLDGGRRRCATMPLANRSHRQQVRFAQEAGHGDSGHANTATD